MRGARQLLPGFHKLLRIIPADAGSTMPDVTNMVTWRDHPRGCGEHSSSIWCAWSNRGSSPRMRGARHIYTGLPARHGIIPADAGSTFRPWLLDAVAWDHPRGCGEHQATALRMMADLGSSPRMRGAPVHIRKLQILLGIIPADAGSTGFEGRNIRESRDHPRGCGEHPRSRPSGMSR